MLTSRKNSAERSSGDRCLSMTAPTEGPHAKGWNIVLRLEGSFASLLDADAEGRAETHFEWLARIILEQDRRQTPFSYRQPPLRGERRRWDLKASLLATERLPGMLLRNG